MHACYKEHGVIDTKKEVAYGYLFMSTTSIPKHMKLTNLLFVKGSRYVHVYASSLLLRQSTQAPVKLYQLPTHRVCKINNRLQ